MLKRIKKLLQLLEHPEVVALLRWLRKPIGEYIIELRDYPRLLRAYCGLIDEIGEKCVAIRKQALVIEQLNKTIARYRSWEPQHMRFGFTCQHCNKEIAEVCPPEMRWHEGQGLQLCAVCTPKYDWDKETVTPQRRELRSRTELFHKFGLALS
jgi:hypothetical protein